MIHHFKFTLHFDTLSKLSMAQLFKNFLIEFLHWFQQCKTLNLCTKYFRLSLAWKEEINRLTRIEGVGQLLGELGQADGEHDYRKSDQLDGQLEQGIRVLGQALLHELQQQDEQHAECRHQRHRADVPEIHGRQMLGNKRNTIK